MAATTVLGNLGAPEDVLVDRTGRVTPRPGGFTLEWWIGAADRWHQPAEAGATAVTQRRVDGLPVLETSLRVPGGQIVHRCWCVTGPSGPAAVVEVENRSRDAVAVALVVTPPSGRIGFDGQRSVAADGRPAMTMGRVPARAAAGNPAAVEATVLGGEAPRPEPFEEHRSAAAFVFPLAHTARLRVALPTGDAPADDPDRLPEADAVVRGWRGHIDAGVRVALPERALAETVLAARAALLVAADRHRPAGEAAAVAAALDAWGHHPAAALALAGVEDQARLDGSIGDRKEPEVTAAVLGAWAAHARATGDTGFAEHLVGPAAKAAHRLGKLRFKSAPPAWFTTAQHDTADLLDQAGQPDAADLCRERAGARPAPAPTAMPATLDDLLATSGEVAGPDADTTARFLLGVRRLLVDDDAPGALVLLPAYPDGWLGQEVEAHRLPTRAGLLSYAVRWHGARPALLWELHGDHPATITVAGLDPTWSTGDPVGEGLLGPVEPAGGLPKVVAPLPGPGTPADGAPGDGVSFG